MNKPRRGRPPLNLTDAEKKKRRSLAAKKSRKKVDVKNLAINGELLAKFIAQREKYSKEFGFKLTSKQFFTILLQKGSKDL